MPGAAIREQIIGDTLGVYLRDSTLYDAFKSLVTLKLITADPRKHYHLTDTGRRALELRSRTMQWSVRLSQDRLHWR
jgi:DNA-binding PadR family transcriptional regulator